MSVSTRQTRRHDHDDVPLDPAAHAFLKALGRNVRLRRLVADLSQEEVGERAGISRNFMSSIERGAHGVEITRMVRVAAVLGVSLKDLLPELSDNGVTYKEPAIG